MHPSDDRDFTRLGVMKLHPACRWQELQKCLVQHPERYPGIGLNILRRALISCRLGACDMKMHPPRDMKCTQLATDECTQRADGRGCRNALPSILSVIP